MVNGHLLQLECLLSRASCGAPAMLFKETKLEKFYHFEIPIPHPCVIAPILRYPRYPVLANHNYQYISIHVVVSRVQATAD
jgi:hypothetical protein